MPNFFACPEVAARYSRIRPFFHRKVTERICGVSGASRFRRALDVGCGTGQSAVALAEIADSVLAIDSSEEMLAQGPFRSNIEYRIGWAEQLNFGRGEFDLVSVGSALHWFNRERFFAQCRQVLSAAGWLAIYNDHFTAYMEGVAGFKQWMRTRFAQRYPAPLRGLRDMDEPSAAAAGFRIAHASSFTHLVRFSRAELIAYLLTHSNTLAAIYLEKETAPAISAWLDQELRTFLPHRVTGSFIFKCNVWLLQAGGPARGDENGLRAPGPSPALLSR